MQVADLFASLGMKVNDASFAKANASLERVAKTGKRMASSLQGDAFHFNQMMTRFNPAKPAEDAVVAWDGWQKKQREAINWQNVLDRSTRILTRSLIAAGAAFYTFTKIAASADSYNSARSRIIQFTDDVAAQTDIQQQLFRDAQASFTEYGEAAKLFQQVGKAATDLGKDYQYAIDITDTLNKAIKASGAEAEPAKLALRQLSQGLGSGTLRGEEFNAVIEQAPVIIDLIAKSMGKTRGEMRKLANDGKLTSKVIFKALESQAGAVDEAFKKRVPLVSDAFVQMKNNAAKAFGELLADKEVAAALSTALGTMSTVINAVIAGFGAMVRFFSKHTSLLLGILFSLAAAFTAVAVAAAAAWLAVYGPIALVIAAVAALAALIIEYRVQIAEAIFAVGDALVWLGGKFADAGRAVVRAFRGVGSFIADVGRAIRDAFESALDWVEDRFTEVVEWITDKLEWLADKAIAAANLLPGVDLARPDFSSMRPPRAFAGAGGGSAPVTQTNTTTINVTSTKADPAAVADETSKAFGAYWDGQLRNAAAGVAR